MKISTQPPKFEPVVIVLETPAEVVALACALNAVNKPDVMEQYDNIKEYHHVRAEDVSGAEEKQYDLFLTLDSAARL